MDQCIPVASLLPIAGAAFLGLLGLLLLAALIFLAWKFLTGYRLDFDVHHKSEKEQTSNRYDGESGPHQNRPNILSRILPTLLICITIAALAAWYIMSG